MTDRMEEMTERLARDGKRAGKTLREAWEREGQRFAPSEVTTMTGYPLVAPADAVVITPEQQRTTLAEAGPKRDIPTAVESARERFEAAVVACERARVLRAELAELDDADDEYEAALRALGAAIAAEVRA